MSYLHDIITIIPFIYHLSVFYTLIIGHTFCSMLKIRNEFTLLKVLPNSRKIMSLDKNVNSQQQQQQQQKQQQQQQQQINHNNRTRDILDRYLERYLSATEST